MSAELAERIVEMAVVRPGDSVIVKVSPTAWSDAHEAQEMAERIREVLGPAVRVAVFSGDIEITVLRTGVS